MTTILAFAALIASLFAPSTPQDLPECDSRATVLQNCYWTADQHAAEIDSDFWVDENFTTHRMDGGTSITFDYSNLAGVTAGMAPCQTEDAEGPCYWDARVQGNGQGQSFTVTADQEVLYW